MAPGGALASCAMGALGHRLGSWRQHGRAVCVLGLAAWWSGRLAQGGLVGERECLARVVSMAPCCGSMAGQLPGCHASTRARPLGVLTGCEVLLLVGISVSCRKWYGDWCAAGAMSSWKVAGCVRPRWQRVRPTDRMVDIEVHYHRERRTMRSTKRWLPNYDSACCMAGRQLDRRSPCVVKDGKVGCGVTQEVAGCAKHKFEVGLEPVG